ncbi:tyrosine-type recombinase/integrase [Planctomycetota bacterium]
MRIRNDVSVGYNKARKRWLVRWHGKYDPATEKQQRFGKSFERKRDAERFAQSLKSDLHDGISVEPKAISLQNLCDKIIAAKKGNISPETIDSYQGTIFRLINAFGPFKNIKTISQQDAQSFINNLKYRKKQGTLSDYSRLRHLKSSRVIFNFAVNSNYIRTNPFKGISIKNLSKDDWHFVTPKEFTALMANTDNLKQKTFYSVMYLCGLRFGEAIHLWWDKNFDFTNNQIHLKSRKSQNGYPLFRIKGRQNRSIDCPEYVMALLKQLKEQSTKENPYLFLTDDRVELIKQKWPKWQRDGREDKWKNSTMVTNTYRKFRLRCQKAGIITPDRLSVHCLRKSYGTNLADIGIPPHTLKSLMGHSSITTTMKFYIKVSDENKKKAVKGLQALIS